MKSLHPQRTWRRGLAVGVVLVASVLVARAHTPNVDSSLRDWCVGAFSNTAPGGGRMEDRAVVLTCGNCSVATNVACKVNTDCGSGQGTCVNTTSKTEIAWWDNRTDGAVNDLGTVAMTQDNSNLYIAAELWVDPDPVSLPFGEIAIDWADGGLGRWHDPGRVLRTPGRCSAFTDRACTSNADCHFCQLSTEPFPSTRVRTCGSGCDPDIGDVCQTSQTCVGLQEAPLAAGIGASGSPVGLPDYLVLFDFSLWLVGAGDATLLMRPNGSEWTPVLGCPPDFVGDSTACDFPPAVNPGASGGSGGPPGSVEVAIPWSAFGCTGCPGACVCPGFGPGKPFRFTMTVARGNLSLDFTPDGAHEDVMSEVIGGTTTASTNDCDAFGIGNTRCELVDGTADGFVPRTPALPHEAAAGGRVTSLRMSKAGPTAIGLEWSPSCSTADTDFGVYEGTIGSWYSHVPVVCSTGGTTAAFEPAAGNTYYLIVPRSASVEGSYSLDGAGAERPPGVSACAAQSLGCP